MDGRQRQLKRSLQQDLNRWILSATLVFALLAGTVSGWVAFDEAQEQQDTQLQQVATVVANRVTNLTLPNKDDPDEALFLQRLGEDNPHSLPIPADTPDGLHTLTLQSIGWRVFVYTPPQTAAIANGRLAVSQRIEFRNDVAWGSSLSTALPILLLAPILMAVVSFAVSESFKPVRILATLVDQCDETRLDTLPDRGVPEEIIPFVTSLNRLLTRLRQALVQQQRFVADAAHELRTPVTALSLLAENLANATTLEEAQARLAPVQEGLKRMCILVTQLLDLARLQGEKTVAPQPVALQPVVQAVIADLYPLAEAKAIDLGMPRCEAVTVLDVGGNLSTLVRNALENAIRYTPAGGVVDVSLFADAGQAVLLVEDNGCGIPEDELAQVLEPFYRVGNSPEPGNGLGLAISQEIAQRLDGVIRLANRRAGGLVFQYCQKHC